MNYQRMIDLLLAVKQMRVQEKNDSPYVCDNLGELPGIKNNGGEDADIEQIRADIHEKIGRKYSVPVFLGLHISEHEHPRVREFRLQLIDELLQTYTTEMVKQALTYTPN